MVHPIEMKRLGLSATAAPDALPLSGLRVMIVEDDYYLATEAQAMLEAAGAEVIGPHPGFEQFERALEDERPDCAVVDINLGEGPSFTAAECLKASGVPFIFLTGYSPEAVRAEFRHIHQQKKPVKADDLVQAVKRLVA